MKQTLKCFDMETRIACRLRRLLQKKQIQHHDGVSAVVTLAAAATTTTRTRGAISSFSTSSSGGGSGGNPHSKPMTSWERGARLVKNTKVENQYLEHIRDVHDPSLHLKTIEDELKGTIGKALGKQGEKIMMYLRAMDQEEKRYQDLLKSHKPNSERVLASARTYNQHRKDCIQARWELMVHRQAAGFLVNNHNFVTEKFPIGEPLPESDNTTTVSVVKSKETKTFGDQLDWWQRVGRWR